MPKLKESPTVPASPTPDVAAIVAMVVRLVLLVGGAMGFAWANMNAAQTAEIVSLLSTLVGMAWAIYEPFRVQQHIDAAAKVSAQHASARAYPHYKSVTKGLKL
jgi:hypothetical protein